MSIVRKFERFRNAYIGETVNQIKYYNWFKDGDWWGNFIRARFPEADWHKFSLVSVFGSPRTFWFHKKEKKIFFTGENPDRYPNYKNHALPHVKLSLGFDYLDAPNYLRFPLWYMYLFKPESTCQSIQQKINEINNFHPQKSDFCALICKHGGDDNLRGRMFDEISSISKVSCPGLYMHNDDRLWGEFKNSKHDYLKNFKFTICPENSNRSGYVTEKLFEAFKAGTIPLYWGSDNNPEPGLINKDAVIFWNNGGDNTKNLELIAELHQSNSKYQEFVSQPRFQPQAAEKIWSDFQKVEQRLKEIIQG